MIFMIIGMAIVTVIPRILPALVVDKWTFPRWFSRGLNAIPYAALGALIFPGITSVVEGEPHIGALAGVVAAILAFLRLNVMFVLIGAIVTVYLLTL